MKKKLIKSNKKNNITYNLVKKDLSKIININPSYIKYKKNKDMYKELNLKNFKTSIQSKTERENLISNDLNNEDNYYSFETGNEEEEEEFDSDEYISSTMLDVETNTYIDDQVDKKSSHSNSQIINKKEKIISPFKLNDNQKTKKFNKIINIKNKDLLYKIKNSEITNLKSKKNKKNTIYKNNNNSFSPQFNKNNNKNQEILYKKIDNQNKNGSVESKEKKIKSKKNLKIDKENKIKNNSIVGYNSPLNVLYNKEFPLKLDNINSNFVNLLKNNNNTSKYVFKKIKTDIYNYNSSINEKYKTCKHNKTPITLNNNSINKNTNKIKELIKQQYKKLRNNKYKRINIISPKNQKIFINSMKILNSINTINRLETPKSSFVNNINRPNRIIYYANNNLSKNNNTIIIRKNNYINNTINLNNVNNFNHINRIIFSPLKREIDKNKNRNSTPTYGHPFNSNSISIDNINIINSHKNNSTNKISDKSLTYNFQDQKVLSRNKTFKNKRHINKKNKFFNLLINKKKIKSICGKSLYNIKKNSKSKSPKTKDKINNLKKIKNNIIKKRNQNIMGLKSHNKNENNYIIKNSYLNSSSNRNQQEQLNKQNLYKRDKKSFTKHFIYIKKENISNIVRPKTKKNYDKNPLNQEKKKNNLTISKSNKRYLKGGLSENKDKEININLTSVNLIKNEIRNKKIKLEIGCKKKKKYRAKTLLEEDYLRDILINNKDIKEKLKRDKYTYTNKLYKNNNIYNNINFTSNNFNETKKKKNHSPSLSKNIIIKNPSNKHDINFNININMNNNDFKKLICYYNGNSHGHSNSLINYNNNSNKNERNSNISYNPSSSKNDNNLPIGRVFYKKRNSNEVSNGELTLNKNKNFDIYNNLNYSNNYINIKNEIYHFNNNDNMDNIPNSFNNYNNYIEDYYDNISSIINKNRKNRNLYKSKNMKKQFGQNQTLNEYNQNSEEKNKLINNTQIDKNNTFTKKNIEQEKNTHVKGNNRINIKLTNNYSENSNSCKINNCINNFIMNNKKVENQS